jgi:hypothetical protein
MATRASFSLRNLFIWCSFAAIVLAIVGLGFRGVAWARGATWGMTYVFTIILFQAIAFWGLMILAKLRDVRRDSQVQRQNAVTTAGVYPKPDPEVNHTEQAQ